MADEYNPQLGANLDDIDAALRKLDHGVNDMVAASRAARRQGVEPSRREVEQETARARQQQVAFNRPLTKAQQARLDAEIAAGKASEGTAKAAQQTQRLAEETARQEAASANKRRASGAAADRAAQREAQARELLARQTEAEAAQARLARRFRIQRTESGKSYYVQDASTGQRAEGYGYYRQRAGAESARAHAIGSAPPLPEVSRYAAALREASSSVKELAARLRPETARPPTAPLGPRQQYQSPIGPVNASPAQRYIEAEQRAERLYWAERARKVLADKQGANRLQEWERTALQRQLAQAPDVNPRAVRDAQAAARDLRLGSGMVGGVPRVGQASLPMSGASSGRTQSSGDVLAKRLEKAAAESDRFTARMYRSSEAQERLFGNTERASQAAAEARKSANRLGDAQARLAQLEAELAAATKIRLSATQRQMLQQAASEYGANPASLRDRTLNSLRNKGLLQDPLPGSGRGFTLTEKGRGVADPSLIEGDIQKQRQYIARLTEAEGQATEATKQVTQTTRRRARVEAEVVPPVVEAATVQKQSNDVTKRAVVAKEALVAAETQAAAATQASTQAAIRLASVAPRLAAARDAFLSTPQRPGSLSPEAAGLGAVGQAAFAQGQRQAAALNAQGARVLAALEQSSRRQAAPPIAATARRDLLAEIAPRLARARDAAPPPQRQIEAARIAGLLPSSIPNARRVIYIDRFGNAAVLSNRPLLGVAAQRALPPGVAAGQIGPGAPPPRDPRYVDRYGSVRPYTQRALPQARIAGELPVTAASGRRRYVYLDTQGNMVENIHRALPLPRQPAGLLGAGAGPQRRFYVDSRGNAVHLQGALYPGATGGGPPSGPPPPPRRPTAAGGGFGDPERASAQQNALAAAVNNANRGIQRQTAYINASSRAYRQHGALTTEFIEAAARGETSYREWGYQIGATAAKFAGWTAVSIPVFAAIDGVRQIGQGALNSADGVNQLGRVLNDIDPGKAFDSRRAQEGFRNLSQEFNVPIETAARAVYLAGQRFHNFDDAVKAARTSLFAFKTGELDIEVGTQQLNAVTQAFGLTADDLASVYDKINAAQNQFGAQQADLIAGLARAGGAFRNAGGDVSSLITLLVAARVAAGRTGSQAATAIQRSAGYYRRPSNQEQLRAFGINPNLPFYRDQGPSVVGQAVDVTRTLQQRGDRDSIRLLAQSLSSPEFASMFEPILLQAANTGQLRNIATGVARNAPDSAAKELRTLLGSPREQLNQLGNELERFGSNLAQSGILTVVVGMVGGFRRLLGTVNTFGQAFGRLPESVRAATIAFGLARGGLLLARRGGLGENSDTAVGRFFTRSPEAQARVSTRQAMREFSESLRADQQAFAQQARKAFVTSANASERLSQSMAQGPRPHERIGDPLNEQYAARLNAEHDAVTAARGQARALEDERKIIDARARDQLVLRNQARRAAQQRRSYDFAVDSGFLINPVQNRPSLPYQPGALTRNRRLSTFSREAQAARQLEQFGAQAVPLAPRTGRDITAYLKQAELAEEATRTAAVMGGTRQVLGETRFGLRSMAQGARGLGAALYDAIGPIGLIVVGLEADYAIFKALMEKRRKADERAGRQGDTPYTPNQRTEQIRDARKVIDEVERKAGRGRLNNFDYQQNLASARNNNDDYRAALGRVKDFNAERTTNRLLRSRGMAQVGQTRGDIEQTFHDLEAQFRVGAITVDERARQLNVILDEINAGNLRPNTRKFLRRRVQTAIRQEQRPESLTASLFRDVDAIDTGQIGKEADALGKLLQAGGGKGRDFSGYFDRQIALLAQSATDRTPTGRAGYAQRAKDLSDTLEGAAQVELQRSLDTARSQGDRDRAYNLYYERVDHADENFKKRLAAARAKGTSAREQLAKLRKGAAGTVGETDRATGARGTGSASSESIKEQERLLTARIEAAQGDAVRISAALDTFRKNTGGKVAAMRAQQRDDEQSVTDLHQYDYSPGADRTAYLIRRAGVALRALLRDDGASQADIRKALTEQRQLREQQAQDELSQYDSQTALIVANAGVNEDARSRTQMSRLRGRLSLLRHPKHGTKVDQTAVTDTLTQIRELQNQQLEQAQQEATDLLRAQYNVRESLTDDPVKIAQLEEQFARAVVRRGGFKNEADRLNAVADKNKAVRATRDARLGSKADDIEFELSMEQISVADAADRYAAMARIHGISKQQKRQWSQRAHDLRKQAEQDSSNFDLDVGSIKMPTIYDVRRAFGPIRQGIRDVRQNAPQIISSYAQPTTGTGLMDGAPSASAASMTAPNFVQFNISVTDPNAAGAVYAAIDRAMKTKVKAKLKSRGHR